VYIEPDFETHLNLVNEHWSLSLAPGGSDDSGVNDLWATQYSVQSAEPAQGASMRRVCPTPPMLIRSATWIR
jgi:hypothetical protein